MKKTSKKIFIAPSILSADFGCLAREIRDVEKAGCDAIHVDVMDGHFVPNLTIGPVVVRWARKVTTLPMDVHLMIEDPLRYLDDFRKAGSDWITLHAEAAKNISHALKAVRQSGAKAGLSIRPKTPLRRILPYLDQLDLVLIMSVEPGFGGQAFMPETMEKVKKLRSLFPGHISVDGGINAQTAVQAVSAGADILVAGTAVFGQKNRARAIRQLRAAG